MRRLEHNYFKVRFHPHPPSYLLEYPY
jgi:hypothetical protein